MRGPRVFLSYSSKDRVLARAIERALKERGMPVWRDERNIVAGEVFPSAIENGLRECRAVVVLATASTVNSEWVNYEYAFAKGAQIPIVGVRVSPAAVPGPLQFFQFVEYADAGRAAECILEGIRNQSRAAARERASTPKLVARFQEVDGQLKLASKRKPPAICMDLWMEQVPRQTRRIAFEILDLGFHDRKWAVSRQKRDASEPREFLTDDMDSYGDVEIWTRGVGSGAGNWSMTSRLYEALVRYYRSQERRSAQVRRALKQIREY